ncbi:hypothetical protein [Kribbella sp. NPDC023855]|uniref:hypothetical protein n=1 Tax=Kribbella sp. NPDC023855 TaxID=3154698 RepID=UPI0033D586E0
MTAPPGSPGDELRAYYGCQQVESRTGLRVVAAFDSDGRPTGQVAFDADEFCDWLDDLYEEGDD